MESSGLNASNGNVSVHSVAGGIDLAAAAVQSGGVGDAIVLTADRGDVVFGSIDTAGSVVLTATTGAINGTAAADNLTGLANGITAGSDITLNAATGIGSASVPILPTHGIATATRSQPTRPATAPTSIWLRVP